MKLSFRNIAPTAIFCDLNFLKTRLPPAPALPFLLWSYGMSFLHSNELGAKTDISEQQPLTNSGSRGYRLQVQIDPVYGIKMLFQPLGDWHAE